MGLITIARGGEPEQYHHIVFQNAQQGVALLVPGSNKLATKTWIPIKGNGDTKS